MGTPSMNATIRGTLKALALGGVLIASSLAVADNSIRVGSRLDAEAMLPGESGALLPIFATNDESMEGFGLSIVYGTERLELTGFDFSNTVTAANSPGGSPDFAQMTIVPDLTATTGSVVIGVVLALEPMSSTVIPASPMTEQNLINLVFDVDAVDLPFPTGAPGLNPPLQVTPIDGQGSPPVDNLFSSGGFSVEVPTLVAGEVEVANNYFMRIRDICETPGTTGPRELIIEVDNPLPINGFTVVLQYDPAEVEVNLPCDDLDADPGNDCSDVADPFGPFYTGLDIDAAINPNIIEFLAAERFTNSAPGRDAVAVSVIFDFLEPIEGQNLEAGSGQSILRFEALPLTTLNLGDSIEFELVNGIGSPPRDNFVVVQPTSTSAGVVVFPNLESGSIEVNPVCEDPVNPFVRGDTNADGIFNVADAISIISFLFQSGAAPPCFQAADSNDDNSINIADVVYDLNYLFVEGPLPPPPFALVLPDPGACGTDPTPATPPQMDLPCDSYPACNSQ